MINIFLNQFLYIFQHFYFGLLSLQGYSAMNYKALFLSLSIAISANAYAEAVPKPINPPVTVPPVANDPVYNPPAVNDPVYDPKPTTTPKPSKWDFIKNNLKKNW